MNMRIVVVLSSLFTLCFPSQNQPSYNERWFKKIYSDPWDKRLWSCTEVTGGSLKTFDILKEICMEDHHNKINYANLALKELNIIKNKRIIHPWESYDYADVEELIDDKNIFFNDQNEKNLLFLKLVNFIFSTKSHNRIGYLFPLDLSLESHNKIMYCCQPSMGKNNFYSIQMLIKKHKDQQKSIETLFKPMMYRVLDNSIEYYSYKESIDVQNAKTVIWCFYVLKKNKTLIMPRVLVNYMIEQNILRNPISNFVALKKECDSFQNYCEYIKREIPLLMEESIKSDSLSKKHSVDQVFSDPEIFLKIYDDLKNN